VPQTVRNRTTAMLEDATYGELRILIYRHGKTNQLPLYAPGAPSCKCLVILHPVAQQPVYLVMLLTPQGALFQTYSENP